MPINAKLDAQIGTSNSLSFLFSRSDRVEDGVGASASRPPETLRDYDIPTNLYRLSDSQVFSPSLFAAINGAYMQADYSALPVSPPDVQAQYYDGSWHSNYYYLVTKNPQHQINTNATKFFNTGSVSHELKFGFGYRHQLNDSASACPGQQVIASGVAGGSGYAIITRGANYRYEQNYLYGYLGDTLTAGNFTIAAGVRYDYQTGKNLESFGFGNQMFPELLPDVTWPGDTGNPFSFKNWEPRVSVTYALGKEKKTLARASYARFADQLGSVVLQLNGVPYTAGGYYYWVDSSGDGFVQPDEVDIASGSIFYYYTNPFAFPNVPNQVQPGLKTPTTDEFVLGVDHQLMDDFAISVAGTYRHQTNLIYRIPTGSGPNTWALVGKCQRHRRRRQRFHPPLQRAVLRTHAREPTRRQPLPQPTRSDHELLRRGVLGDQAPVRTSG